MTNEIVRASDIDLDSLQRMAKMMVASGYFDADRDVTRGIAQMAIKIMAGREMGYGPFASVQGIHVIQGKPSVAANLMAAAVKAHPRYDYRVRKMCNDGVAIEFFENGQSLGTSEFTAEDATAAGTQNMKKFARNMLFARALSNGVRWYCPDVFNGSAVYVPEELGADVDGEGNIVDMPGRKVDTTTGEIIEQPQHRQPVVNQLAVAESNAAIDELGDTPELAPEPDNPFQNQAAGVQAEPSLAYAEIADGLTGNCLKLATWAADLHINGSGPASAEQYRFLSGTIDESTGGAHSVVLSVLCRRYVTSDNPCSKNLAGKLLDFILKRIPEKDAKGNSLKGDDGKVIYRDNPNYRAEYVACLRSIAQAVEAYRTQPVEA